MSDQYRSILKATSIFGGTQILQILVTFVKSKFVALLIGAEGMGVSAMYNSTITLFITICGLGIGTSVIRDLSKAYDEGDEASLARIAGVFRRLMFSFSIIGGILVVALAKPLSIWSFGTADHQYDYMILSLMLIFTLLKNGNISVLTGTRKIKKVAMCSLWDSVVSLLTSVPLFYFFGMKGIAPGFAISTVASYVISYLYYRKLKFVNVNLSFSDIKNYGKTIVLLGVAMVASLLLGNLTRYLTNIAVSRIGNIADLGYYNAAIGITMQSISLVFSAMASDYFPRLSAAMKDKELMNETVKQQTEIIFYLVIPILSIMMVAAPLIVRILLTEEFYIINGFIRVVCIGMFFKAASYPLGYLAFAKGDKQIFFWLEGVYSNFSGLILSILFYYLFGLNGLAWAMFLSFLLYYIIATLVGVKRYQLIVYKDILFTIIFATGIFIALYALSVLARPLYYIIIGSVISAVLSIVYLNKLNNKTGVFSLIKETISKRKNG